MKKRKEIAKPLGHRAYARHRKMLKKLATVHGDEAGALRTAISNEYVRVFGEEFAG